MTGELKPYPVFKDSGVDWLGSVPTHWGLEKTKRHFIYIKELNKAGSIKSILSLTLRGVVNNNPDNPEGLVPRDYRTYQRFEEGDLVFKLIDLENYRTSRVGLVHQRGVMSPAYVRLSLRSPNNVKYFYQQFYDLYLRGIFNNLGAGVRSTLSPNDLLNIPILVPPRDEQDVIVRFLDAADARIRRYIRAKQKLIKLLNEMKQAIIQQAVTRGLDPDVPMKDSGVEWLGEIPAHWEVSKLARLSRQIVDGTHFTPTYLATGIPFLRVSDIHAAEIDFAAVKRISHAEHEILSKRCKPENGDLLLSKNGTIGVPRVVDWDTPFSIFVSLCLIKLKDNLSAKFASYFILSDALKEQITAGGKQNTVTNLHLDKIRQFWLSVPPMTDQTDICLHLDEQCRQFDKIIEMGRGSVSALSEYRARLIADVVTGKVDVRSAEFELPEGFADDGLDDIDEPELTEDEEFADTGEEGEDFNG